MNFQIKQWYIGKRTTHQKKINYEIPIRTVIHRKKTNKSEKKLIMNFRLEQWYIGKRTTNQKKNNYEFSIRTAVYRKKKNKSEKKL